jgi:hypothetical protein
MRSFQVLVQASSLVVQVKAWSLQAVQARLVRPQQVRTHKAWSVETRPYQGRPRHFRSSLARTFKARIVQAGSHRIQDR